MTVWICHACALIGCVIQLFYIVVFVVYLSPSVWGALCGGLLVIESENNLSPSANTCKNPRTNIDR